MSDTSETSRALSLDALRGLSILLMVFSGRIPYGVLPDWMYHAQVPPPGHVFNPGLPGITWVDLVFPFFLFTMGAALPLALTRRLTRGGSMQSIIASVLLRGLQLAAFAIFVMHIRPWLYGPHPDTGTWLFCLAGFLLLFPMYARFPSSWSAGFRTGLRVAGWAGAAVLMAFVRLPDGSGFSLNRSDIIILVLSNVAVGGALIWLATREHLMLRLGLLAILLAMRLSAPAEGWVQWLWNSSPVPWLFRVPFLQYLFLVVPGTVCGDLIVKWMERVHTDHDPQMWSRQKSALLGLLMVAINVVVVVGLKARWGWETTLAAGAMLLGAWWLVQKAGSPTEKLIRTLFQWGAFWLMLGLLFEPYEGGIKKDHPTMSYYFVTGGLAALMLIALTVALEIARLRKGFMLLIRSGQNPLVAYAGIASLVPPVLGLIGLDVVIEALTPTPWLGVLRGALMTYLVALAASVCTRNGILLKT